MKLFAFHYHSVTQGGIGRKVLLNKFSFAAKMLRHIVGCSLFYWLISVECSKVYDVGHLPNFAGKKTTTTTTEAVPTTTLYTRLDISRKTLNDLYVRGVIGMMIDDDDDEFHICLIFNFSKHLPKKK